MMRIVHTADWHLGHVLYDRDREAEHRAFLDWLLDLLEKESVDVLLLCGDVFEGANPPASALALWYGFLADASRRCRGLQVVVVAGNHDSPARLEAPAPVLAALSVNVVGFLPRAEGEVDVERLVVPLRERSSGEVAAWVAAVPFLRLGDLPGGEATPACVVDGVRGIYANALEAARAKRKAGQALLATGHCYVEGMRLSDESERKVLGGNQHPLPVDVFPADVDYVALGHLHFPQQVGGRGNVRYSGSPLPLSLDEDVYPHQVCLVELQGGRCGAVKTVRVPRSVTILRLPDEPAPLAEVLALLEKLPAAPPREAGEPDRRPWLEVRVRLEGSEFGYQGDIAEALEGKDARLVKITPQRTGSGETLADGAGTSLSDLTPETVFRKLWERENADPVPAELEAAFHELVDVASQEEAS
ncbi:MAG: exonuclease SbcCD subunit D C-terminal domain-containing protein [Thermoanaerobaculia bacterium]|jgi:exonuclease SbcD|nr:exonuclease SbcCD subunit D C-terminal domain-containing protein [Thermoanaerobaculia bacterium]